MRTLRSFWRNVFDVREGERLRTLFMVLYLFATLFAYYILKNISKGMFLGEFKVDDLPKLNIILAAAGGVFAYGYTRLAMKTSLRSAVAWASAGSIACLAVLWWLLGLDYRWKLYVFNIWVSMFSVVMVTQCWLVAANVFTSREAKRVYSLLAAGAVLGSTAGSSCTKLLLHGGSELRSLLWWAAAWVVLAYGFFRAAAGRPGVSMAAARAAEQREAEFSFKDILHPLASNRHLQLIIAITMVTLTVDVMIEFQMSTMLMDTFGSDKRRISEYLALYTGAYQSVISLAVQLCLTALVVRWFGIGGTLQVMPVSLMVLSAATVAGPSLFLATGGRVIEQSGRYTLGRTAVELLYMPLPLELRNRTKAFIDIFVDRFGRGLGGFLQWLLLKAPFTHRGASILLLPFSLVTLGLTIIWSLLSWRARKEYLVTVREKIASRRLDLETLRAEVQDPATIEMLEQIARGPSPRQAAYALSLLADVPGYEAGPLLKTLADSPHALVRARVFELAQETGFLGLLDRAMKEIRSSRAGLENPAAMPAVRYAVAVSPEGVSLAARLIEHPNHGVVEAALESMGADPARARGLLSPEWLSGVAADPRPERRRLAAVAVRVRGDEDGEALVPLLSDPDGRVAEEACRAARSLHHRAYIDPLVKRLGDSQVRSAAIEALASYGDRILGTLGDLLDDRALPLAIRRQVPRVLRLIHNQRSVDVLLRCAGERDPALHDVVLRALNRLRESAPNLDFSPALIDAYIRNEVWAWCDFDASLAPFLKRRKLPTASGLLARTLEERKEQTLERLFRLLGLRYRQSEVHAAYRALKRRRAEDRAAALDFLDNILERDHRRLLLRVLDEAPGSSAGFELFGIAPKDAETAIRSLIQSGDAWVASCAIAAAGELKLRAAVPQIEKVARSTGPETGAVARAALVALA